MDYSTYEKECDRINKEVDVLKDKYIEMTFNNENDEQSFIRQLIGKLKNEYVISIYIQDLDVDIVKYKEFFSCEYIIEHGDTPAPIIKATNINEETLYNIVDNWGFYSYEAFVIFTESCLKAEDIAVKKGKLMTENTLLVMRQVLDYTLEITVKDYLYDRICGVG